LRPAALAPPPERRAGIGNSATPETFPSSKGWRRIAANRELVAQFVGACVDTIALFKTEPDVVVPLLQRYLQIDDRKSVEQVLAYYAPLFQSTPRPTFVSEIQRLRGIVARKYPAASNIGPEDLADASFVDELDRTGYIARLYSKAK